MYRASTTYEQGPSRRVDTEGPSGSSGRVHLNRCQGFPSDSETRVTLPTRTTGITPDGPHRQETGEDPKGHRTTPGVRTLCLPVPTLPFPPVKAPPRHTPLPLHNLYRHGNDPYNSVRDRRVCTYK